MFDTTEVIGRQLRYFRHQRALSQEELAEKAGVSRITVLKLEAGRQSPWPSTVRRLAKALGVTPEQLRPS